MKNKLHLNKCHGFTLIELMVTIAIAAILMTLAVPGFRDMMQNNRAYTQSNALLTALNLARSEAIKKKVNVFVCSSTASATCTTEANCCIGSNDWSTGWVVVDDNDTVVQRWEALDGNPAVTALNGTVEVNKIFYFPTGFVNTALIYDFEYAACSGKNNYAVEVSASGRPEISKTDCP